MLPKKVKKYFYELPKNRNNQKVIEEINYWKNRNTKSDIINSFILSQEDSEKALKTIGLKINTTFYKYYHDFYDLPDSDNCPGEELYGLKEILEDYKDPFWGRKYPDIEKKYLQFTSIEGEGSYFYDKQTDAVYDVDWNQMDDFMQGKLKPWFNSFYDFLEWYYSEEDE